MHSACIPIQILLEKEVHKIETVTCLCANWFTIANIATIISFSPAIFVALFAFSSAPNVI
jgi:hypothetical protein